MKNSFFKFIPILSTSILVLVLCLSNQKESSKLKLLIWETPTLSLGTYIAISTTSGFIISYISNVYFASFTSIKSKKSNNSSVTNSYNTPNDIRDNNDKLD